MDGRPTVAGDFSVSSVRDVISALDFRTGTRLDHRVPSGGMPEMDDLNALAGIVDPVIDPNRRVQDGADIRSLGRDDTDVRKSAEKVHMVQKGVAEPRSSVSVITRNIVKDFEKIVPGPRGNDYFERRRASSWRSSSSGMPCPPSSWAIPSSMARRVDASSAAINSGTGWSMLNSIIDSLPSIVNANGVNTHTHRRGLQSK